MYRHYNTNSTPGQLHQRYWQEVIGNTYFSLQLRFPHSDTFQGALESWDIGAFSLSRLQSDALRYQRLRSQVVQDDDHFLVTIPQQSEIEFSQFGRSVTCKPGGFILEHSNEPYEFGYGMPNAMWVLKLPGHLLRNRLRSPERFCAMQFEAMSGMGVVFSEFLQLLSRHRDQLNDRVEPLLSQQLTELLAVTLEDDPRVLQSANSAVRSAHLRRVEEYIRRNIQDPNLTPEHVARSCAISTRYLHLLFKDTDRTVSQWIKELRLQAAYDHLMRAPKGTQIGQIAYQWGFADQAQFCNAFKTQFGIKPSELRKTVKVAE